MTSPESPAVEPIGPDVAVEIAEIRALTDDERTDVVECFERPLAALAGLPWVLSGRLGAFVQGAPVRVSRLDLAVAEGDLDRFGRVLTGPECHRWNDGLSDYFGVPAHPRLPGPMRWMLGRHELRLEVAERLPPAITVVVAGRALAVRPLPTIEDRYADVARVMRWVRAGAAHR